MPTESFGAALRAAREQKGYTLVSAARRLRIRPDVLETIENADFAHMPPRGYARNMVCAYARLVGLNTTDITRRYLEEAQAYQQMRSQHSARSMGFDMGDTRRRSRAETRRSSSSPQASASRSQYTNYYAGPTAPSTFKSKLPFIIALIVVIAIIVCVCVFVFGNKSSVDTETPVPISGLTDTSNPVDETATAQTTQKPVPIAPEKVVFVYSVPQGFSAYIEVYEGDSSVPSVAETVSGPAEKSFDVTTTLKFVTSNPDGVVLSLAGTTVTTDELTDAGGGVYTYTVDFAAYLEQWRAENIDEDTTSGASVTTTTAASTTAD